jgi:hypothetical protein
MMANYFIPPRYTMPSDEPTVPSFPDWLQANFPSIPYWAVGMAVDLYRIDFFSTSEATWTLKMDEEEVSECSTVDADAITQDLGRSIDNKITRLNVYDAELEHLGRAPSQLNVPTNASTTELQTLRNHNKLQPILRLTTNLADNTSRARNSVANNIGQTSSRTMNSEKQISDLERENRLGARNEAMSADIGEFTWHNEEVMFVMEVHEDSVDMGGLDELDDVIISYFGGDEMSDMSDEDYIDW